VDSEKNAESWDQAAEFFKAAVVKKTGRKLSGRSGYRWGK